MTGINEALGENRDNWDERARLHVESYHALDFADDPQALERVVEASLELMAPHLPSGSLSGLDVVHLQCHIGNDSISLARLGANVTGIDFSGEAISTARELTERAGLQESVRFVQTAIEDASAALSGQQFDVVYTSMGVLCWLPDLAAWAASIDALLKPGGLFFIHEDHPLLQALEWDDERQAFAFAYPYFHVAEPTTWDDEVDYSSTKPLTHSRCHEWAHPISEIITVLLDRGLTLESFREHRTMFWKANDALIPVSDAQDEYALRDHPERIPLTFSLAARKPL